LFHILFGFTFSYLFNFLYREGDIFFFHKLVNWENNSILNPELTMTLFSLYIIIFAFSTYYHAGMIKKEQQLQLERMQHENAIARYINLKSQVEPHFLFNSLSVLSSLIQSDEKLATEFVLRLSRILRYVIEKNELLLIPLKEEITFVENYMFLLQTRFQKGILFENRLEKHFIETCFVPPASLQLLIENSIKHNKFSEEHPLMIKIYNNENEIVVSNNLNMRNDVKDSTKQGLSNLIKLYSHCSDKKVVVNQTQATFAVLLPKLTRIDYERFNY
jgi:two-component system LytT family sensor kinase